MFTFSRNCSFEELTKIKELCSPLATTKTAVSYSLHACFDVDNSASNINATRYTSIWRPL